MLVDLDQILAQVVQIATSPYVPLAAAWLKILESDLIRRSGTLISKLLPGADPVFVPSPSGGSGSFESNPARRAELVALLADPDILKGIVFLSAGSEEIRFLKAFHSLRPHLYAYIAAIEGDLTEGAFKIGSADALNDLAKKVGRRFNSGKGNRPPFQSCFEDFEQSGYLPLLDYVEAHSHGPSEKAVFKKMRDWRGAHYRSPEQWVQHMTTAEEISKRIEARHQKVLEDQSLSVGGAAQLANYAKERRLFMWGALVFSTRLAMAYRYLGLSTSMPTPSPRDAFAYTELGDIAREVTCATVDDLVNRSNSLIYRSLDFVIGNDQVTNP